MAGRARTSPKSFATVQEILAKNVAARLRKRKQAIRPFAELADVSPAMLHSVLGGTANPSLAWITKLAEALDVEVHELLKRPPG